ncbi:MAG: cell envelope integrity protein TolA [Alphaproteobacteria bacterium]|nr:cell envelope integrity protein TolA [Alphaproteobacteria bacterium]
MEPSGLALSGSLHLVILLAVLIGLPNLFHQPPPEETPIAVQLVTIAPDTRATHPNPYRPKADAKPDIATAPPAPKPEPKPEPPQSSEPPPSASSTPAPPPPVAKPEPKPTPAPPPPPPKPVEAQAPPPPPLPRPPEPKPQPQQQAREMPRPEPARKPDPAAFDKLLKNLEDKKPQPASFDTLLKNLSKQQTAQVDDPTPPRQQRMASAAPSSQPKAPLGSQLSASERDMIIQQIERCWVVPAGARDADNLVIEIKASVNPDGSVTQASIVDSGRYGSDPFFRAAADSAKRAVLNPQCSPLPVPPDKYEAWHNLDLFFNPKDLL